MCFPDTVGAESRQRGPPRSRLQTAGDVLALLNQQIAAVRLDPDTGPLGKARAGGYLARVALKAIEASNLAARIEMIEAVLKQLVAGEAAGVVARPQDQVIRLRDHDQFGTALHRRPPVHEKKHIKDIFSGLFRCPPRIL